ncbi:MAG TPA: twin-arginine translocase TatA/TatE family subunit [Candidatus Wallbacteria bacterium]|nr:twin-arginine translocase TatA/TatE family subunit [Candidatus Wallbacteria bacterium]
MFGLNTTELIVILIIALVVFGPNKLPLIGGAVGKSIREFKKSLSGDADADSKDKKDNENAAKEDKKDNEEK